MELLIEDEDGAFSTKGGGLVMAMCAECRELVMLKERMRMMTGLSESCRGVVVVGVARGR